MMRASDKESFQIRKALIIHEIDYLISEQLDSLRTLRINDESFPYLQTFTNREESKTLTARVHNGKLTWGCIKALLRRYEGAMKAL
jgi:hypothetical protein